jgi:hypothetical protein
MTNHLHPRQRRRLIGLTLVLAAALLGLMALALSSGDHLPDLPVLIPAMPSEGPAEDPLAQPPTRTPPSGATPWGSAEVELGTEPRWSLTTPQPIFLPLIFGGQPYEPRTQPTQAPEPDAVPPTPVWPDGLARLTNSKLGLHVIRNNDPFIMEFIRRARPRVVKAVDDLGWLADVKRVSPNTITIGRINQQNEDWVLVKDPIEAAREYVDTFLPQYQLNPGADYWEGWNEFVPVNSDRMAWYAAFEAERACYMQSKGLRAAVGGFSVGVPEYDQMGVFLPALQAAYNCDGIFTLHEYNSPTLTCGVAPSYAGLIPGAPDLGDVEMGYHTLRYRFWYEGYLKPRGLGDLPLVISEAGVEGSPNPGGPCNDPSGRAWKSYADYWVANGHGPSGPEAYVNLMAWYDQKLREDEYVWGATVFSAGADAESGWHPFDLHDVLVPLAYYAVAQ